MTPTRTVSKEYGRSLHRREKTGGTLTSSEYDDLAAWYANKSVRAANTAMVLAVASVVLALAAVAVRLLTA